MANEFIEFKPTTPMSIVQQHRTDICGLTKHEYMALELTKAWASTRCQAHETKEEVIDTYVWLMNEVEKRNL